MSSVVIAPDSFKGTASARAVASAIAEGWLSVRPHDDVRLIPQADGGEGTLDAIETAVPGSVRRSAGDVTGPDGRPTPGEWLLLPDGTAVVELAQSSGLPLMKALDPLGSTTRGLGEVIAAAIREGATSLVIGLGGSASTDGAAGALAALGLELLDSNGAALADGGAALAHLASVDRSALLEPPPGGVVVLTDVTSPLLGATGAAAVFGPQKGADASHVSLLDRALSHYASVLGGDPELPGSGAAGGSGFGFVSAWGAQIEPGADYLARLTGLASAVLSTDVLITGEGRFDSQSTQGKLVGQLLALARSAEVPVGVIAGQVTAESDVWTASLTDLAGSAEASMADPLRWLRQAGALAARELA